MKDWVLYILLILLYTSCARERADMVIHGGKIYTADINQPEIAAVAIKDGKILSTGNYQELKSYVGTETVVLDLKGKTMVPGFIEGHGHLMEVGYNEQNLDLLYTKNFDEIIRMVEQAVKKAEPGEWILGRGWHQDKWDTVPGKMIKGFPLHQRLSEVSPLNPVFLEHASGHAGLANAKAMEIAGVNLLAKENYRSENKEGGEIITDELGNPTGLFNERAVDIITTHIPNNKETDRKALELALMACHRNGITSFHDAGVSRAIISLYRDVKSEGKLSVRLYVMLTGNDPGLVYEFLNKGREVDPENWLTIRAIKLNCDGALGSRGAWLLEPYTDRAHHYGMATLPMDTVLKMSRLALQHGFQVCSHAIGDRANHEILNRYETALLSYPTIPDHRFRIEHAQHLHPDDILRFSKLGVIPAMQAIHMSSDRPWAIDRLGEKRIKEGAYVWQALLKSGVRIVNGTDAPIEPLNPIACFYASVSRKTLKGTPADGYEPAQKMTREQALRSYTIDAAYGAFEEGIKGSIEKGKVADFTVLDQDIMQIAEEKLLQTQIVNTIVAGKVVYEKK